MAMSSTTSSLTTHLPKTRTSFRVISQNSDLTTKKTTSTSIPPFSFPKSLTLSAATTLASTLASTPFALAAKQIAESPQEDNRGLALLLPLVPAVAWVLFNILQPALNQINKMRGEKAVVVGLGGLGLGLASGVFVPVVKAAEEMVESEGGGGSSGLLPFIVAGAVALEVVLFSTMQSKYEEKKAE